VQVTTFYFFCLFAYACPLFPLPHHISSASTVYDDSERIITNAGVPGWVGVQPDIPFTPTVYFDGAHHPVCFDGDDSDGANEVCQAAGFPHGGRVLKKASTNKVHDQNAKLVSHTESPVFNSPLERFFTLLCGC
jgi:hypothetical protein